MQADTSAEARAQTPEFIHSDWVIVGQVNQRKIRRGIRLKPANEAAGDASATGPNDQADRQTLIKVFESRKRATPAVRLI